MTPAAPASAGARSALHWAPALLLLASLLIFARAATLGWNRPLLGPAAFRQTQTAIAVEWMLRDGLTMNYETPVLGAPWQLPFEFPTYQLAVATVVKAAGIGLEPAGRIVSLGFALTAFLLLGWFVRSGTESVAAGCVAATLALTMPANLHFSRAFLIESTALGFGLALLVATQSFIAGPTWRTVFAVFCAGLLCGLTKATTYAVMLVAVVCLLALSARQLRQQIAGRPRTLRVGAVVALAAPFVLSLAWVWWTDRLKLRNEFAAFLTSSALHDWNYGSWSQRMNPATWRGIARTLRLWVFGWPFGWLILALTVLPRIRASVSTNAPRLALRTTLLPLAAAFCAGPLVFTNLYFVHEYYFYAIAALAAGAGGVLFGAGWEGRSRLVRLAVICAVALIVAGNVRRYWTDLAPVQLQANPELPEFAAKVAGVTAPDSVLLIEGSDWDSSLPYYAHRRALTNRYRFATDAAPMRRALARLDRPLGALVFLNHTRGDTEYIAQQIRGLARPFERVDAPDFGEVYVPVADASRARLGSAWREAGFGELPWFARAPAVELTRAEGRPAMLVHAPGLVLLGCPASRRTLRVSFAIREDAYADARQHTDGVTFAVEFTPDGGAPVSLLNRRLDPWQQRADRGFQSAVLRVPGAQSGSIRLSTEPGPNAAFDWAIWRDVTLE